MSEGIRVRHARNCPNAGDRKGSCKWCKPAFEASVWDRRTNTKRRKTFPTQAAAKAWRSDTLTAKHRGQLAVESRETVKQAGSRWLEQARSGEARQRSGARYKPKVLRVYASDLERYVFPELGHVRLSELRRRDVQWLVEELTRRGLSGSRIRGILMPLRVICRRAIRNDEIAVNPTAELDLPADDGKRDRVASPDEAELLLGALAARDRPLWATALYAGLRRGELRALRWTNISDDVSTISVEHGWDDVEGEIDPKSAAGRRIVFVAKPLRQLLLEHKARTGGRGAAFVFGATAEKPFEPTAVRNRAVRAWKLRFACGCKRDRPKRQAQWARNVAGEEEPPRCPLHDEPLVRPIGLHECRHSFSTFLDHAGVSSSRADRYMGHSSGSVSERYRHLLPAQLDEDRKLLEEYLAGGTGARTGAHPMLKAVEGLR